MGKKGKGRGGSSKSKSMPIRRLIDPTKEYRAVKRIIKNDCRILRKCSFSVDHFQSLCSTSTTEDDLVRDGEKLDSASSLGYFVSQIGIKLISINCKTSIKKEEIKTVFPGVTDVTLHLSQIPTRSILLLKTETQVLDHNCVEERFYSSPVDLNGLELDIFQGKT